MAFTFTKTAEFPVGQQRVTMGTYGSAGGSEGGDIYTGLQKVNQLILQPKGTAVVAAHHVVNETFPIVDPVTIVSGANEAGYWMAIGY